MARNVVLPVGSALPYASDYSVSGRPAMGADIRIDIAKAK